MTGRLLVFPRAGAVEFEAYPEQDLDSGEVRLPGEGVIRLVEQLPRHDALPGANFKS